MAAALGSNSSVASVSSSSSGVASGSSMIGSRCKVVVAVVVVQHKGFFIL